MEYNTACGNTSRLLCGFLTSQHQCAGDLVTRKERGVMGYKYQNKLDEEREREYWKHAPWWHKLLYRLAYVLFILLALWGSVGWLIAKLFGW